LQRDLKATKRRVLEGTPVFLFFWGGGCQRSLVPLLHHFSDFSLLLHHPANRLYIFERGPVKPIPDYGVHLLA
jgi:hypothetical protein